MSSPDTTLRVNCHSDFLSYVIGHYQRSGDLSCLLHWQRKLNNGDVNGVLCAVGGDGESFPSGYTQTFAYFTMANQIAQESRGRFLVARSATEFDEARHAKSIALFLGLEGCHALEGQLKSIEAFYKQGLRWLALTWNLSNEVGDGAGEAKHGGLTPFGRDVIKTANHLGIVVDLVHTSHPTFHEAAAVCRAPFIVSHSNAAAICPHPRNLTDEQIHLVASSGGLVGINFFPRFLTNGEAQWADIERHICYIADLVGPEHVTLGPDFIDFAPEEMAQSLSKSAVDYGKDFSYPPGFSDDSCFRAINTRLEKAGFRKDEIKDIMGRNILRVVDTVAQMRSANYEIEKYGRQ